MRKQTTPEQKAKAEAKREKFKTIATKLRGLSEEQRAQMAMELGYVSNCTGRVLSMNNSLMLHGQREGVTIVGGFRQWKELGRVVQKGERGLLIWVKAGKKEKAGEPPTVEDSADIRFLTGTVFDVSQTTEQVKA